MNFDDGRDNDDDDGAEERTALERRAARKRTVVRIARRLGAHVVQHSTRAFASTLTAAVGELSKESADESGGFDQVDDGSASDDDYTIDDDDGASNDEEEEKEWKLVSTSLCGAVDGILEKDGRTFSADIERVRAAVDFNALDCGRTFWQIATNAFADGRCDAGRIAVIYAFAAEFARRLAVDCEAAKATEDQPEMTIYAKAVTAIESTVGDFVAYRLSDWIVDNGGWTAMTTNFQKLKSLVVRPAKIKRCPPLKTIIRDACFVSLVFFACQAIYVWCLIAFEFYAVISGCSFSNNYTTTIARSAIVSD